MFLCWIQILNKPRNTDQQNLKKTIISSFTAIDNEPGPSGIDTYSCLLSQDSPTVATPEIFIESSV